MKILAAGDFHEKEDLIDSVVKEANSGDYDLFLALGDYFTQESYERLMKPIDIRKLGVTGNRDFKFDTPENEQLPFLYNYTKANMDDWKIVVLGAIYPDNFYEDIKKWVKGHPKEKLIFATHYPPHMILDLTHSGNRAGIPQFRNLLMRTKPVLWLCGHVHEAAGVKKLMKTTVVNAAVTDTAKAYSIEMGDGVQSVEGVDLSV